MRLLSRLILAVAVVAGIWLHLLLFGGLVAIRGVLSGLRHSKILTAIDTGPQTTLVYDRRGKPIFSYYIEQRIDVPLERVSPHVVDAVLAVEDRRFWGHRGLDPLRTVRAAWVNLRAGRIVQGGSTITQQLARTAELTLDRTISRKMREAILATEIEERYEKRAILQAYLNSIYFGDGYYGIEAASRGYFGKPASALDLAEAATLAGVIKAPSAYSPSLDPVRARARRDRVLRAMLNAGVVREEAYSAARGVAMRSRPRQVDERHDHAAENGLCGLWVKEEIRRELVARFGQEVVYRGGLRVYSTVDTALQREAERTIAHRLAEIEQAGESGGCTNTEFGDRSYSYDTK